LVFVFLFAAALASAQTPAGGGLQILVISGEDGVNIIQKNTAVQPVVEVRDRNNLPVAGALVTFMLPGRGNPATFANAAKQITLTTDSTGRATVNSLQAMGKGSFKIQINASYQGQTATTSISQTNFASLADAAKAGKTVGSQSESSSQSGSQSSNATNASSSTGQAGSAGSAAGGGGGGIGAGTIAGLAVAGAGAVAGAVYIPQLIKPDCTSQENAVQSALNNEINVCGNSRSSFSQCTSAASQAFNALGSYCTCVGTASDLTAEDRAAVDQALASARQLGVSTSGLSACLR
jgi:hypothetical protein